MSERPPSPFDFSYKGRDYLKLCLDITVYWRGSVFDRVSGVLHFYRRAVKELKPRLKFFETGTMSGAKPLKADALEMVPTWFAKSKPRKDIYIMTLESGAHRNEPSDGAFYVMANEESNPPVGVLRLMCPPRLAEEDPDKVIELTQDLISELDFESGHIGYGVNWDAAGDMELEAKEGMYQLSRRYLGIDLSDVDVTTNAIQRSDVPGIKCVNWLTLLGHPLVERIGGSKAVERGLKPPLRVYKGPSGIIVRAGAKPTIGDRNRNDDLSAYRTVSRLLQSYRYPNQTKVFGGPATPSADVMAEWLARFDV